MNITPDKLYKLLPALYRIRDVERGEPLKALLSVIAKQLNLVEDDVAQLYENWFIETCEEWLVPYIGDLLGVKPLHPASKDVYSQRAYVANTLAYRRRKGTLAVLEQLARDVTGWPTKALEFFQLIVTSQHLNHLRLDRPAAVQVCGKGARDGLELLNGPFEKAAHSIDVRRIVSGRGKYNLPNIGLYLWRLKSFPIEHGTAAAALEAPDGCYTFSPLGKDMPLFNPPQTEESITHLAEEINVPAPLRRLPLCRELQARRQTIASRKEPVAYYFGDRPVFEVYFGPDSAALKPEEIVICNLDGWEKPGWKPPASIIYGHDQHGDKLTTKVAVDPVLGRLTLLKDIDTKVVEVTYSYGFSSTVGGGPYNRRTSVATWYAPNDRPVTWQLEVNKTKQTLKEALEAWNTYVVDKHHAFGLINITDNRTYPEDLPDIVIPDGCRLAIAAAGWLPGNQTAKASRMEPDNLRPHILGDFVLVKPSDDIPHDIIDQENATPSGEFIIDGLLVEGTLTVKPCRLGRLHIAHSTLVPGVPVGHVQKQTASLLIEDGNPQIVVEVDHAILGAIQAFAASTTLCIIDSIVDASGKDIPAIAGLKDEKYGPASYLERSTIIGTIAVRELYATETIMMGTVTVERCQTGCVRFSYLPLPEDPSQAPQTPPRYRCQPCLEIETQKQQQESACQSPDLFKIRQQVCRWLVPNLVSFHYGHPAYGQLSLLCPKQIRTGAQDGSEMGVFCHLKQPQREANLRLALTEYLRSGLEAGIIFAPQTVKEEVHHEG